MSKAEEMDKATSRQETLAIVRICLSRAMSDLQTTRIHLEMCGENTDTLLNIIGKLKHLYVDVKDKQGDNRKHFKELLEHLRNEAVS